MTAEPRDAMGGGLALALIKQSLDDNLAGASTPFQRSYILHAWIMLGIGYVAREQGRAAAMSLLRNMVGWVKFADLTGAGNRGKGGTDGA